MVVLIVALVWMVSYSSSVIADDFDRCTDGPYPSYWQHKTNTPPDGSPGFKLSQSYPRTLPVEANQPWRQHNPFSPNLSPEVRDQVAGKYLNALLGYVLEGNVGETPTESDFDVCKNAARDWYHIPWMHWNPSKGREYRHGLTRELEQKPKKLHPMQSKLENAWAIGFYNSIGAYTVGQIFPGKDINDVNVPTKNIMFNEGTVVAKVIFTSADNNSVPYLIDAPEWIANVTEPSCGKKTVAAKRVNDDDVDPKCERKLTAMRLIQLDVAVVDKRAPYRWVFGTFVYNGTGNAKGWRALDPVGLQWGNDHLMRKDAEDVKQTSFLLTKANDGVNWLKKDLGCGGRLNGPVDNPQSSCMSCHAMAAVPVLLKPGEANSCKEEHDHPPTYRVLRSPLADFDNQCSDNEVDRIWFRNIMGGASMGHASICDGISWVSLDYSLQLRDALTGYFEEVKVKNKQDKDNRVKQVRHREKTPHYHNHNSGRGSPE